MNFLLGGMGMHGLTGSPLGAGRYPNPQLPWPVGVQAMLMMGGGGGPGGGGPGGGFGGPGGLGGGNLPGGIDAGGVFPPFMPMGLGGRGFNPWMSNDPMSLGMGGLLGGLDDDDESFIWDSDEDAEGLPPFDALFHATQKRNRKRGKPLFLSYFWQSTLNALNEAVMLTSMSTRHLVLALAVILIKAARRPVNGNADIR